MGTISLEIRRRARFEALRRSIFAEMGQAQARMRLVMIAPFHAVVLAILAIRGMPSGRVAIQAAVFLLMCGLFAYRVSPTHHHQKSLPHLALGFLTFVVSVGNTGGLASPLLPLGLPMLAGASVTLGKFARAFFFTLCAVGFTALALLSRTAVGDLPVPL